MNKSKVQKTSFAKKSFGQNFLVDRNYISKIISALNPQKGETIIEIGAGRGALTEILIESGANVIAIELERDMIAVLRERFTDKDNFKLIESDALTVDFLALSTQHSALSTKLVANLPYYISTAILQTLIEQRNCFSELILMFQREVVERITARVGNSERGFLTVMTEAYLTTEKLFNVPPTAFLPAPKVWSSVVRLLPKDEKIGDINLFREIVSAGFVQKRKTIFNNLKNIFGDLEKVLQQCRIDSKRRAETLTIEEWKCLASSSEFRH
jgi:16S rRNA (adenine1518-N6/adenine1519-N6)-dimethyltransferase